MTRIDAHQHFWSPARGDYGWMDSSETLAPLRRPILPADFEEHRRRFDIQHTVLVQAAPSVEETEYLLGLADATPWIAKVVGWLDFEKPEHRRHLERFSRHPKFSGVRPMIQDIADSDWMHRPEIQWAYRAVIELDLTFDALGFPLHLENFARLFDRYREMRVVIDHGMKPAIRAGAFDEWAAGLERIAQKTPVFCKLSGLATEAGPGWSADTLRPYASHIISAFGAGRVMWGSDWPVLELVGTYEDWWQAALDIVGPGPDADEVFAGTARRFYRIN